MFLAPTSTQRQPSIDASTMSRRASRKLDIDVKVEASEIQGAPIATPKKGRNAVKTEDVQVVAKENITLAKSRNRKVRVESEDDDESEEDLSKPAPKPSGKPKINRVRAKAVIEEESKPKPKKAPAKRKAKADDDEEDADEPKTKKKRKTKEEKEAETMPLAERTVIGVLKKAMHIGAHVSGAGGTCPVQISTAAH